MEKSDRLRFESGESFQQAKEGPLVRARRGSELQGLCDSGFLPSRVVRVSRFAKKRLLNPKRLDTLSLENESVIHCRQLETGGNRYHLKESLRGGD